MANTIAVVTAVSLRDGHVTRRNFLPDLPQKFERVDFGHDVPRWEAPI